MPIPVSHPPRNQSAHFSQSRSAPPEPAEPESGTLVAESPPATDLRKGLFGEQLIRLDAVADILPRNRRGRKVGLSSLYRWCDRGVRGVRLEWIRFPWGRVTSMEAIQRFVHRLNEGRAQPTLTPNRRKREIDRATQYVHEMLRLPAETKEVNHGR